MKDRSLNAADIEKVLREALDEEPPRSADGRILAAIRLGAVARRRRRRWRVVAAAAALAVLFGGGLWRYGRDRAEIAQGDAIMDEGEIMLEIIDMAEPLDFEAFQVAQL